MSGMALKEHPRPGTGLPRNVRLAENEVVATTASFSVMVPVLGSLRARVRIKLSAGDGTLTFDYVQPSGVGGRFPDDGSSLYATSAPTDLSVPDTNEVVREIDFYGEAFIYLTYTDTTGGSTIEFLDISIL